MLVLSTYERTFHRDHSLLTNSRRRLSSRETVRRAFEAEILARSLLSLRTPYIGHQDKEPDSSKEDFADGTAL